MRCAVIYSSRTGNTRRVAEAVHEVMPLGTILSPVDNAPEPSGFDFLALGFWVSRGMPDPAMLAYMERVAGKGLFLGLFGTLGAYPDSDHAVKVRREARLRVEGNTVLGEFLCMGRVDPRLLKAREAKLAKGHPVHPMTPERAARLAEAAKHPDATDLEAAREVFRTVLRSMGGAQRP